MSPQLRSLLLFATILLCSTKLIIMVEGTTPDPPPTVPALYVFGDSTVDGGNNPSLHDPPYGIDLNSSDHLPIRNTNGETIADYIANFLHLPIVPPYSNATAAATSLTGVNFAYAGCGMLIETNLATCRNWTLQEQITKFQSLVFANLSKAIPDTNDLASHLSSSIFLLSIGINDYVFNFVYPNNKGGLGRLAPNAFSQILLTQMSSDLTVLYGLGARKFLVNNIWPLGCAPAFMNQSSPLAMCCNETVNEMVLPYSNGLPGMLKELESKLTGAVFSHSDNFKFVNDVKENGYGISNTTAACFDVENISKIPCADRDSYLYWDFLHTSQAANHLFSTNCYNGDLVCTPNIVHLAAAG